MTTYHNPYKELEHYLAKAQDEISKAVNELQEHENNVSLLESNTNAPIEAFRSASVDETRRISYEYTNCGSANSLSNASNLPYKWPSATHSKSSNFESIPNSYSPNTRKRLWRMSPSISFPETSKDLLLYEKVSSINSGTKSNNFRSLSRSNSETPFLRSVEYNTFPRPPSGDVNLLSLWADNLVLELDKSLSVELQNSSNSFSPSSDYSLSPTKIDGPSDCLDMHKSDSSQLQYSCRALKSASRSLDSGIEQTSCNSPEIIENVVDALFSVKEFDNIINKSYEFQEDINPAIRSTKSQAIKMENHFCQRNSFVKSAETVLEIPENSIILNGNIIPQSIPVTTFEIEKSPVIGTVCGVDNDSLINSDRSLQSSVQKYDDIIQQPFFTNFIEYPIFASLPMPHKNVSNGVYQRNSLPRCDSKGYNMNCVYHWPSQYRVFSNNYVCIDEVLREMETENKDAVTQTTPVARSRSSSFTCVSDCDCSDWEICLKPQDNLSSDDDDSIPSSDSSSLYLSACSGSSQSFEDISGVIDICSTTQRNSNLDDITEEQLTREVFNSNSIPNSFSMERPDQPIEPKVLIINELNGKSMSAPVLLRQKPRDSTSSDSLPTVEKLKPVPTRSHSAKELNELQAIEACSWLRAAGFPQYAQMYEDNQFPIDICTVQKDHAFLPPDFIQSLFRRLNTLNKCAKMKFMDHAHCASVYLEDSDEEEQYALSEHWEFERSSRRWSRIPSSSGEVVNEPSIAPKPNSGVRKYLTPEEAYCSSHDSVFVDSSPDSGRRVYVRNEISFKVDCSPCSSSGSGGTLSLASEEMPSLRRSGSDRVKEGAKALLKRMESLKRKKKKTPKNLDTFQDSASLSDSECQGLIKSSWRSKHSEGKIEENKKLSSPGNLQQKDLSHPDFYECLNKDMNEPGGYLYDNACAPIVVFNDKFTESPGKDAQNIMCPVPLSSSDSYINQDDGDIIVLKNERRDSGVGSSLTRTVSCQQVPWHCFPLQGSSDTKPFPSPVTITDLTAPQILLLRKLSLLKLTTIMENFSTSSRTGWSWGVSKIICRIRNPDYKDKVIFGVPLLVILQRTGQPLPVSIQTAMQYLRKNESTGLFRKSGVRSRIQKLKSLTEENPNEINYEEQQAYDVADMWKQYFRELPESLLTNKLSGTFISIFQFVPEEMRLEAIQSALMLMPDENREVLHALLEFLYEICQHSGVNQMTATNISVCFAPSLFHLSNPRSASSSPRRRKTVGVPDLRELNENRAASECLSCMVSNYKTLFTVSNEIISQSRIFSASYLQPMSFEDLSLFSCNGQSGWTAYFENCIQLFLKEAKEKYKNWKSVSQSNNIEIAYKKLSDGYPLKIWKVSTEIEAPPVELLNRILRERHLWDITCSKSQVISRINKHTEVFQYLGTSLLPNTPCDYVLLRSWRTDLPKEACILIETSIQHPDVEIIPNSVRGLALASRYLIEPCGSGKSRITYISRVDTKGRSPEWYNRAYGHICFLSFTRLRYSFARNKADGPETKV